MIIRVAPITLTIQGGEYLGEILPNDFIPEESCSARIHSNDIMILYNDIIDKGMALLEDFSKLPFSEFSVVYIYGQMCHLDRINGSESEGNGGTSCLGHRLLT